MSIGYNIAKYRKAKHLTQEELGVSNQAVSKWESETSMPDIMLLPQIAESLDITLNDLYGIGAPKKQKVCADEFPQAAYDVMFDYFCEQSCRDLFFHKNVPPAREGTEKGKVFVCLSDISGGVFINNELAFIDTTYKEAGSESIFNSRSTAQILSYLSEENCRKVLMYQYKKSFEERTTNNIGFSEKDVVKECGLSGAEAYEALEKLTSINLEEKCTGENNEIEYYFRKLYAIHALMIFKIAYVMIQDPVQQILRDTSTVCDYAFKKLWK